jgi:hypothetical protein
MKYGDPVGGLPRRRIHGQQGTHHRDKQYTCHH